MAPSYAFVAFTTNKRKVALEAQVGGEWREWSWRRGKGEKAPGKVQEFLDFCGEARLVCHGAASLKAALSRPEMPPGGQERLGRLIDLLPAALLIAAEAPKPTLEGLRTHYQFAPSAHVTSLLQQLMPRLQSEFAALPRELHVLLRYVLGEEAVAAWDWLPWPELTRQESRAPLALLPGLLPRQPRDKRAAPEATSEPIEVLSRRLLQTGGAISRCHEAFEERPAQIALAGAVAETLRDGGLLVAEAGTGVGKSLAYLIPSVLWARANGKPILVSTNTKNLQEQLISKDLPLLARALPLPFRAALLKGRGNYPCVRTVSWLATDASGSLFFAERLAAAYLIAWLATSPDGDLESLPPEALTELPALSSLLSRVRSQGDTCLGRACSCAGGCRVEQVRARAAQADLIVVNHALAFAEARAHFLPDISRVIFDEAHNVEAVATDGLAYEVSSPGVEGVLRTLGGDNRQTGALAAIGRRLTLNEDLDGVGALLEQLPTLPPLIDEIREAVTLLGEHVIGLCSCGESKLSEAGRQSVRLTPEVRESQLFSSLAAAGEALLKSAALAVQKLKHLASDLEELPSGSRPDLEGIAVDVQALAGRLEEIVEASSTVLQTAGDDGEYVTWAEAWETRGAPGRRAGGQTGWCLRAAPIDVGPLLKRLFYDQKEAVVFTSATLSVEGRCDYFRRRVGLMLDPERVRQEVHTSPFDLERQLLLCVPNGLVDPRDLAFHGVVNDAIRKICGVSEGGTLVLFTSRARMREAFEQLRDDLAELDLSPLCQDISGPRGRLLDQLRQDQTTVLFGLKSFWEGVDVPGSALRCVVITKLPFAVPDDPIVAARRERVAREGGDPIADYYIPETILAFKQGIGRVIRSQRDRGFVFVLDPRLLTRGYGRRFFRSIQRCRLCRDELSECLEQARNWLAPEA